jgi:hypothetical protein
VRDLLLPVGGASLKAHRRRSLARSPSRIVGGTATAIAFGTARDVAFHLIVFDLFLRRAWCPPHLADSEAPY